MRAELCKNKLTYKVKKELVIYPDESQMLHFKLNNY